MGLFGEEEGDDVVAGVEAVAGANLGEGLVEEGFEGGAGRADAGGEVGVFEGEELGSNRHGPERTHQLLEAIVVEDGRVS